MSASLVIVREVAGQETAQVPFAKDEYMIQTLAPDGADEPLREGVLPWAVRRREDFTDAHALHALPEHVTVRSATSMPSLRSSPWILGAPHRGLAAVIRLTRALIAASTGGWPAGGRPESVAQCRRKRRRCQRSTVAGATMTRACLQAGHTLDSQTQRSRSLRCSFSRFAVRL